MLVMRLCAREKDPESGVATDMERGLAYSLSSGHPSQCSALGAQTWGLRQVSGVSTVGTF